MKVSKQEVVINYSAKNLYNIVLAISRSFSLPINFGDRREPASLAPVKRQLIGRDAKFVDVIFGDRSQAGRQAATRDSSPIIVRVYDDSCYVACACYAP